MAVSRRVRTRQPALPAEERPARQVRGRDGRDRVAQEHGVRRIGGDHAAARRGKIQRVERDVVQPRGDNLGVVHIQPAGEVIVVEVGDGLDRGGRRELRRILRVVLRRGKVRLRAIERVVDGAVPGGRERDGDGGLGVKDIRRVVSQETVDKDGRRTGRNFQFNEFDDPKIIAAIIRGLPCPARQRRRRAHRNEATISGGPPDSLHKKPKFGRLILALASFSLYTK